MLREEFGGKLKIESDISLQITRQGLTHVSPLFFGLILLLFCCSRFLPLPPFLPNSSFI